MNPKPDDPQGRAGLSAGAPNPKLIIAIDGPAGAGKSTAAKRLARRLGYKYIDTGAMYRAVTLKGLRLGADLTGEGIVDILPETGLEFKDGRLYLDGEDVSKEIRSSLVTANVSKVAANFGVRSHLVALQREMGVNGGIVMEGRDIGTVVFPEADLKFYLDASLSERARRRSQELTEEHEPERLKEEIKARDEKDRGRASGPLKLAEGAILIDTTELGIEEVVDRICDRINLPGLQVGKA
ncbi:MAG: (d)CMP kinase [bacterium]|nr:(d)CMP kinase [bacterium]